jgi:EAL domain-containing protein (putative c-di-GMP-specific phosphodiesterase class I)
MEVRPRCDGCKNGEALGFTFSMAFQPIMDVVTARPFAFEALVRGPEGQSAGSVLSQVTPANRYAFDQQCRVKAIETAASAGLLSTPAKLSINFLPNAVYDPKACIQLTLKTAAAIQFPTDRLIFEFTENEQMVDPAHVSRIIDSYKQMRGLDASLPRRIIIEAVVKMCDTLGVAVIAEGIETEAELEALRALGVRYIQGFLFAKPEFERLPVVQWSAETQALSA